MNKKEAFGVLYVFDLQLYELSRKCVNFAIYF